MVGFVEYPGHGLSHARTLLVVIVSEYSGGARLTSMIASFMGGVTDLGEKNSSNSACVTTTPSSVFAEPICLGWVMIWIGTRREIVGVTTFAPGV